jgi:hypothetical protein
MPQISPISTAIVEFDWEDDTLTITFISGGTYAYFGVPRGIFDEMRDAPSVGRYFHRRVRGQYASTRRRT